MSVGARRYANVSCTLLEIGLTLDAEARKGNLTPFGVGLQSSPVPNSAIFDIEMARLGLHSLPVNNDTRPFLGTNGDTRLEATIIFSQTDRRTLSLKSDTEHTLQYLAYDICLAEGINVRSQVFLNQSFRVLDQNTKVAALPEEKTIEDSLRKIFVLPLCQLRDRVKEYPRFDQGEHVELTDLDFVKLPQYQSRQLWAHGNHITLGFQFWSDGSTAKKRAPMCFFMGRIQDDAKFVFKTGKYCIRFSLVSPEKFPEQTKCVYCATILLGKRN